MIRYKLGSRDAKILSDEFGDEVLARELFAEFLGRREYEREFAVRLVQVAAARPAGPTWRIRCAAALMLESLVCNAAGPGLTELEGVVRAIAAVVPDRLAYPPGPSVAADGDGTDEQRDFLGDLRRRLGRLERVHRRIHARPRPLAALLDFLDVSRQECRVTLARYLFDPHEVALRILDQIRTSHGLPMPFESAAVEVEAEALLQDWPGYERRIIFELMRLAAIVWADEATSSRLNSLVEYPLGTVALVVKPPGSALEFEIKRAGRPGSRPLTVVFHREGRSVPPSHRFDGGSMGDSARAEAVAAARFGGLFRLIHGRRAPISQTLTLRSIDEVPCRGGRAPLLDYLTDPAVFGDGFAAMRHDMERTIRSFCQEWGTESLKIPGDLGMTLDFLSQVRPTQAYLGETSSFRLERLSSYLSEEGPDLYFRRGLGVGFSAVDARRLAETVLDEILGQFAPIGQPYRSYARFIDAVLAEPSNRRRADEVFLALNEETGLFWGTLFGLRGYANGESLVGRNVGIKSVWKPGGWQVRIIFMDHDQLHVPRDRFSATEVMRGWHRDATHVLGEPGDGRRCVTGWLSIIYRVDPAMADRGRSRLLCAAVGAARLARHRLATDPRVRECFHPRCLQDGADWEDAAIEYLRARLCGREFDTALAVGRRVLEARDRAGEFLKSYDRSLTHFGELLEQYAPMLGVEPPALDRPPA